MPAQTRTDDAHLVSEALRTLTDGAPEEYAEAMERVADRLAPDLDHARRALSNDGPFVDAPSVTVHLNRVVAEALLEARGWRRVRRGWEAPDVEGFRYDFDEALTLALTAEGLS